MVRPFRTFSIQYNIELYVTRGYRERPKELFFHSHTRRRRVAEKKRTKKDHVIIDIIGPTAALCSVGTKEKRREKGKNDRRAGW